MKKIIGIEKNYAWGSRSLIPSFQGRPTESDAPIAEVWFGAHPSDSATLGDRSLISIIANDPISQLGTSVSSQFQGTLPYQVKLLAAESPLSIQVHPTKKQAQAKFLQEEIQGIPIDAPHRSYKDANHKPELLLALTPFSALVGLRPPGEVPSILEAFDLVHLREAFDKGGHQATFKSILSSHISDSEIGLDSLLSKIQGNVLGFEKLAEQTRTILSQYPRDRGILCTLLMNRIDLLPGEAIFVESGQLHAYLSGLGVEVMANSDNVLRCGLTSKYINVDELLHTVTWESRRANKVKLQGNTYALDVADFRVSVEEFSHSIKFEAEGPKIVLCTGGAFSGLSRGEALWISAEDREIHLQGSGTALIVTSGNHFVSH